VYDAAFVDPKHKIMEFSVTGDDLKKILDFVKDVLLAHTEFLSRFTDHDPLCTWITHKRPFILHVVIYANKK